MQRNFCLFNLMWKYFKVQKKWERTDEPCFIFQDGSPVTPVQARQLLRLMLKKLGLNEVLYDMHSLRIGRCSDMVINWGTQSRRQNGQVDGSHLASTDTLDIDYLRAFMTPTNSLELRAWLWLFNYSIWQVCLFKCSNFLLAEEVKAYEEL